ncbi:type I secretion system permease/ATPase [Thioclava indica]|nr:type I secretion system permease/ATPase [Thioclava indica]
MADTLLLALRQLLSRGLRPMAKDHPSREIADALKESFWALVGVALFSATINFLMLTGPLFMLQVYDRVLGSRSTSTLIVLFGMVVFVFITMGILDFSRGRVLARIGAHLHDRLDARVFRAVLRQAEFPAARARSSSAQRDLAQIQGLFSTPAFSAVFDLPWAPIYLSVLFLFHPLMGWLAIASTVLILALAVANQMLTKRSQNEALLAMDEAEMRGASMRKEIETLLGLGMRQNMMRRRTDANERALDARMHASDLGGGITAITKAFRILLQSTMLALGAWLVLQNALSAGAMIAGSILLGRSLGPVEQTVAQWPQIQRAWSARKSLTALLTALPERQKPMDLPAPQARIALNNLAVVPPGGRVPTLQGIRLTAKAGDAIAVIGPSASGKSTLARALVGLWAPAQGDIRLDGAELKQYDPDQLGTYLGYLPQDIVLFDGTIAENIARFSNQADPQAIVIAAQAAAAHDLILGLPDGYDTRVTDGGKELSGGQRQRIGLARAFYGDPIILVLDEPNSALDDEGIHALNQAIATARQLGKITFVMSHRRSALAHCNLVLMIDSGHMRAFGPRDEVLVKLMNAASPAVEARKRAQA